MISPSTILVEGTQIYKTIRRSKTIIDQHRFVLLLHHHHRQITTCSNSGALPLSHFHSWINRRISSEAKKPSKPGAIQAIDVGSARAPESQYPFIQTYSKHTQTQNNSQLSQLSQPYTYQQKHTQLSPSYSYSSSLACESPRLSPFSPSSLTLHSKFNKVIHNTLHPSEAPSKRVEYSATYLSTHPRSRITLLRHHSASPTRVKWIVPDFDRLIRQRPFSKFDLPINTSSPPVFNNSIERHFCVETLLLDRLFSHCP
jgi:mannosyltransferase OCH1-like enzyme